MAQRAGAVPRGDRVARRRSALGRLRPALRAASGARHRAHRHRRGTRRSGMTPAPLGADSPGPATITARWLGILPLLLATFASLALLLYTGYGEGRRVYLQ